MSETLCYPAYAQRWTAPVRPWGLSRAVDMVGAAFGFVWFLALLPFRIVIGLIRLIGRLSGIALGFSLMVIGMALWAGPLFIVGIPMFVIGLLLTLRCLG